MAELEGRISVSCKDIFCYCLFISNLFNLHINSDEHSILHKYEVEGHEKNYLFGVPNVVIDLLVQSKISLQDLMLVFWDVTSCSLATVTNMLQPCSAFAKLFKGRCTVSTSWEPDCTVTSRRTPRRRKHIG